MTTGMASRSVSNMVIPKNKVTNGVAWCPVSYGVSPKGDFKLLKARQNNQLKPAKITNKSLTQHYTK